MRVLLVEDEPVLAANLSAALKRNGFAAELARDGEEAWFLGDTEDYDAIVLDLGLPKLDGLSVLKRWRANERAMPVIVLTARGSWMERVEGIDAGADDYLPKPFQTEELIARLHAIIRRSAGKAGNTLAFGPLRIDLRKQSVTLDGAPVALTPLEFRLLAYLGLQSPEVTGAAGIMDHLYGIDHDKDTNALEALMRRLRKKIGVGTIGTRKGVGYVLMEPVCSTPLPSAYV